MMKTISKVVLFSAVLGSTTLAQPLIVRVASAPIPIEIAVQSPAEITTELQVICLFRSSPENTLHGSLLETNEKLGGLLDRVRRPAGFRGDLGETLLIHPREASLGAKRLLIIGLGDSQSFSPQRMELVGEILYTEAGRIGVAHPSFAPTILDGGVSKFATGDSGAGGQRFFTGRRARPTSSGCPCVERVCGYWVDFPGWREERREYAGRDRKGGGGGEEIKFAPSQRPYHTLVFDMVFFDQDGSTPQNHRRSTAGAS